MKCFHLPHTYVQAHTRVLWVYKQQICQCTRTLSLILTGNNMLSSITHTDFIYRANIPFTGEQTTLNTDQSKSLLKGEDYSLFFSFPVPCKKSFSPDKYIFTFTKFILTCAKSNEPNTYVPITRNTALQSSVKLVYYLSLISSLLFTSASKKASSTVKYYNWIFFFFIEEV